jgi:hypothetical protein
MDAKFLRESLTVERKPLEKQKYLNSDQFFHVGPERLFITMEFVGCGDTREITLEEISKKLLNKIGDEI